MNNLQESMREAEQLRRDSEHLPEFIEELWLQNEDEDQLWFMDAEERQREYRDEADTLAGLWRF